MKKTKKSIAKEACKACGKGGPRYLEEVKKSNAGYPSDDLRATIEARRQQGKTLPRSFAYGLVNRDNQIKKQYGINNIPKENDTINPSFDRKFMRPRFMKPRPVQKQPFKPTENFKDLKAIPAPVAKMNPAQPQEWWKNAKNQVNKNQLDAYNRNK